MEKIIRKLEKLKVPIFLFIILLNICIFTHQSPLNMQTTPLVHQKNSNNLHACRIFDTGPPIILKDNMTSDDLFIINYANVTLINYTVHGNIYLFNSARLQMLKNSTIMESVLLSDSSKLKIQNSTVMHTIECSDSSVLQMFATYSKTTTITKTGSASITVSASSIKALNNNLGTGGIVQISNSNIDSVSLGGSSFSQTFIYNSNFTLNDQAVPFVTITGPSQFNFLTGNLSYSTSEREINLTWTGWDSPIINGYLNITFQILVDGVLQKTINGSGFMTQYIGHQEVTINQLGNHTISVIAIDSMGNNFTSTIHIEIIEYPPFPWLYFWIVVAVIAVIAVAVMSVLNYKQKKGYHSAFGNIFKKEFSDNKLKIIIFIAIAAVPGIILYFIFNIIPRGMESISIDGIRGLVSMIFTLFLYYFALVFSIVFGAGAVVNARKSGTLSWFLSKPIRRWEFLWGKIFAYLIIIVLIMISTSISFVLSGISFINPQYIPDLLSMGGYIFLIGLVALIPLTAIVVLCSSVFNKPGLTIFIPILLLMVLPPIVSFLPILTRHEWPLLFSFSYYSEQLGRAWVYQRGGLFSSIGTTFGTEFNLKITLIALNPLQITIILSVMTIICFALATFYLECKDVA